ncbi:AAA family ATPase [Streptomyces sp. NPDC048361]|uniref:helix-turn-helix transcriptional regulator n=1 Tax=Streptomyces sp. NPDC048361 TaxID=3154720 RepID=UPI0034334775
MEHSGVPAQGDPPADPWLPGRRAELTVLAAKVRAVGPGGGALVVRGAAGLGKSALLSAVRGFAAESGFLVLATSGVPTDAAVPYAGLHELLRPLLGSVRALPAVQRDALRTALGSDASPDLGSDAGPDLDAGPGPDLDAGAGPDPILGPGPGPGPDSSSSSSSSSSLGLHFGPHSSPSTGPRPHSDPSPNSDPDPSPHTHPGRAPEPFLVALAALSLLTDAAAVRPVLALVDDLPWLDEASSEVVSFLARRLDDDPVLLCAAARTVPGRRPFAVGLESLELTSLDAVAAAEVLAVTGRELAPAAREKLLASAQGNPLALTELPRMGWGPAVTRGEPIGPVRTAAGRLEHGFAAWFGGLPRPARDAVLVAAVEPAGSVAEILAAAALLGGGPVAIGELEQAEAVGLLRIEANRVRFRHHLVRSSVLHAQPRTRHRAAHTALGAVLSADPYRAAWHHALGLDRPDDGAADELEAAHRIALARGSAVLALRALERAAHLTGDPARRRHRLLLAAEHGLRVGRADLVRPLLDAVARTGPSERDRPRIAWLNELCDVQPAADEPRGLDLCARAEDAARVGDRALALDLLLTAARSCRRAAAGTPARQRFVATAARLKDPVWDPRLTAALALTEPVRQVGDIVAQLSLAATASRVDADRWLLLGTAALAVGDPVLATDFLDRGERRLRERGGLAALTRVLALQTRARLDLGEWHRAAEATAELHRLAADTGTPTGTAGALVAEARAAALRGDTENAHRLADRAEKAGPDRDADLPGEITLVRGIAACAAGHHDEAYDTLRTLFPEDEPNDPGSPNPHHSGSRTQCSPNHSRPRNQRSPTPWPPDDRPAPDTGSPLDAHGFRAIGLLAEAAVHAGRRGEAARVVASVARRTAGCAAPLLRVHLRYAAAVLADDIEAETLFRRALADNLARWPWPRARAELAYGNWLRRQRRTAEARPLLRSARLTFDRIGARPWAARADGELRAAGEHQATGELRATAGGTPPPGETSPSALRQRVLAAGELDPLETQIARLAGLGLSDREVGAHLFLSARTVGAHLSRVLPRLGVASRDQLGTVLDASIG